jgi:hypothetical protein
MAYFTSGVCRLLIITCQNSLGRISFTSDIWSRQNLEGYMAVTAHYCTETPDGQLIIRARLVAFRYVQGSHTGHNLAKIFVKILKELDILN